MGTASGCVTTVSLVVYSVNNDGTEHWVSGSQSAETPEMLETPDGGTNRRSGGRRSVVS